jgi:transposase
MIQVDEKEIIRRLYFTKRFSMREIARSRGHSRDTVKKALENASIPKYHLRTSKPRRVMGSVAPIINQWLKEDSDRPLKQRHTAHRIYERLVAEHNFTGGERTVRAFVAKLRPSLQEMAIPLEFDPGRDAQCDWGEALIYVNDKPVMAQVFCMKLSYSHRPFVMAFPTQRQECFFEGQRKAFEWYGAVPPRIGYDNMTIAVQKVLRGRNRQEQQAFIAFRSHYMFESHFAMPATPREQGRVESLVGYARRNYFVPVPRVSSFAELNSELCRRLEADDSRKVPGAPMTIGEAWQVEKSKLLPIPRFPHPCAVTRLVKASSLSLVNFDGNRYSVPVEYGLRRLTLHAYAWKVAIASGDLVIATHERCYGKEQDITSVEHYLPLLIRRPGAFPYAKPVRHWQMPELYRDLLAAMKAKHNGHGTREFLLSLYLGRSYGQDLLEEAMREALVANRPDYDFIRQVLLAPPPGQSGCPEKLTEIKINFPDPGQFDRLWRKPAAEGVA